MRALQKKMQQLENDLDQAQEQLLAANAKLEEKDKALQNVSLNKKKPASEKNRDDDDGLWLFTFPFFEKTLAFFLSKRFFSYFSLFLNVDTWERKRSL